MVGDTVATLKRSRTRQPRCASAHCTLFAARPQGRPDDASLPRFVRSAQPGGARAGADRALRISRSHATLTSPSSNSAFTNRAARPMKLPRPKDLSNTRPSGTPRLPPRSSAPPQPWPRASFLPFPSQVSVFLSHGSQARRASELVHGALCRTPAHDARARPDRPPLRRRR